MLTNHLLDDFQQFMRVERFDQPTSRSTRTAAPRFGLDALGFSGAGFAASVRLRRRSLTSIVSCDMKLHSVLLGWAQVLTKSCVCPQVLHGSRRLPR